MQNHNFKGNKGKKEPFFGSLWSELKLQERRKRMLFVRIQKNHWYLKNIFLGNKEPFFGSFCSLLVNSLLKIEHSL